MLQMFLIMLMIYMILEGINNILKPNGNLIIEVPDLGLDNKILWL